jgi:probable rRNA maturation factor
VKLRLASLSGRRAPRGSRAPLVALAHRLRPADLVVQLVLGDDALLRDLNRAWRGRDRPTDVLSFRYERRPARAGADAEVYVSLERAAVQAQERGHGVAAEVVLLVLHGLLHVQGHDHERPAEARRMRGAERAALQWLAGRWPRLRMAPLVAPPATRHS